jgi:sugar phosphate isomerase/epimerase
MGRKSDWVRENLDWFNKRLNIKEDTWPKVWPIVQARNVHGTVTAEEFEAVLRHGLSGRSSGVMMFTSTSVAEDEAKTAVMKKVYTTRSDEGDATERFITMNISQDAIKTPVEERLKWARQAGFDAQHEIKLEGMPQIVKAYDKAGMHLAAVYLLLDLSEDIELAGLEVELKAIADHKPQIWLALKGGVPSSTGLDNQAVAVIRQFASMADRHGLEIAIYPHVVYYVERFQDAVRIAGKVNRSNVGVIFNLCHFLKVEPDNDWKSALELAGDRLIAVTINGADAGGEDWSKLIQPLDKGSFDMPMFIAHLNSISYAGPIGLQDYGVQGDPAETLSRSYKAFLKIIKEANNRRGGKE